MNDHLLSAEGLENPYSFATDAARKAQLLIRSIWCEYLKLASDTLPSFWESAIREIRKYFFLCTWNEVYDLLEHAAKRGVNSQLFALICNDRLEEENSAYRFVENEIVEITSQVEIEEIQTAANSGIHGVEAHISAALSLLADRQNPDYRNCVKEAISAVETVCRSFAGGTTLSEALKVLKTKVEIHPAFERSLNTLYGYTSDESGVRHSLLAASTISFSDAKFMLVTCSAFANYLIGKAAESGLKLKG